MTKNFQLAEFKCNDGTPVPLELVPNVKLLAQNLQVLRDELGVPIVLNSAYRTKAYNERIGGKANSMHLKAMAADIRTSKPKELAATIERLIKEGKMRQGGIGIYGTFVHYDVRGTKARW
jgi:uncharacterized protein YcbK (DUF882 family)